MHIWTDLLVREGALLAILLALGAAPASFLGERFDAAGRVALAPILGFCLGTCVATTLLEFLPARQTYWILVPLALLSLGIAARRTLRGTSRARLSARDVAQLLTVCIAVAGPLTYTLHQHHTVGPAAYFYTDVDNYVGEQDGAYRESLRSASNAWESAQRTGARFPDLTLWDWSFLASFDANLNATPLDANVDGLADLGATDTFSPFLISLLLAGALGAFAAVRYATRSATWMAVLAGALFGGPLFLELWFDTFQAAIVALGMILPLLLLGAETLRSPRPANVVLLALVVGCLLSVYPLFIPMVFATGALVLAAGAFSIRRRGRSLEGRVRPILASVAAVGALAVVFDPVGFTRTAGYYQKLLHNEVPLPRVGWSLPLNVLPGWLFQTREFWYMPDLGSAGFKQILLGALLPLAFLAIIALGIRHHRRALALVALAGVCALAAEYAYKSNADCTYCAERDLLPLAPIVIVLLALGLATALAMPQRWVRLLGFAGALLVVGAVAQRSRVELTRFSHGSYFLDSANRGVLAKLPPRTGAVQLEGFGNTLSAQAEFSLVYRLLDERVPGRASIILGSNINNAIEYLDFGVIKAPGAEFHPYYRYVLTRFPGIHTPRRVIARSGGIALQERTQPLDITPSIGLTAPLARLDPAGRAWVEPLTPLGFYVAGATGGPVWARLTFHAAGPVIVRPHPGLRSRQVGDTVTVCAPASGAPPVRAVTVQLSGPQLAGTPPAEEFPPAVPAEGIELTAMAALPGSCRL
ncbi:MAG TPA: hypothetical protein VKG82_07095 [Solirubrobacteraceae bacterium]|nr:hypothetical protein [Solirubrobacteraceae bacterium]